MQNRITGDQVTGRWGANAQVYILSPALSRLRIDMMSPLFSDASPADRSRSESRPADDGLISDMRKRGEARPTAAYPVVVVGKLTLFLLFANFVFALGLGPGPETLLPRKATA